MQAAEFELVATMPTQCELGEGPVWDHRIGVLWFTDIAQSQLLRLSWPSRRLERFDLPERLGSLGLTSDPDRLVCAFASGFARYHPASGTCRWIVRVEHDYEGIRLNDGRVDRLGRFWAGSMVEDARLAGGRKGKLYRLDGASFTMLSTMIEDISISNSICFSVAGNNLYFADTPTQEIVVFDINPKTGAMGNRCRFAELAGSSFPDGSDIDSAGRLWNAEWGGRRVTAYETDGSVYGRLDLPCSQPTNVAFGGALFDHLFVTTAREGLNRRQLAAQPHAGDLFVYRTSARGLPANLFND